MGQIVTTILRPSFISASFLFASALEVSTVRLWLQDKTGNRDAGGLGKRKSAYVRRSFKLFSDH